MVAVDRQRADFAIPLRQNPPAILIAAITEQRVVEQVEGRLGSNSAAVTLVGIVADDRTADHAKLARRHRQDTTAVILRSVTFDDTASDSEGGGGIDSAAVSRRSRIVRHDYRADAHLPAPG